MRVKISAIICMVTMLLSSSVLAYTRGSQGYSSSEARQSSAQAADDEMAEAEEIMRNAPEEEPEGSEDKPYRDPEESEKAPDFGMTGMQIGGYVLLTIGGLTTIAGSTLVSTSHKRTLGYSLMAGGAAVGLGGSLMIMLGGRRFAVAPQVDPKSGTYGLMVAKRF